MNETKKAVSLVHSTQQPVPPSLALTSTYLMHPGSVSQCLPEKVAKIVILFYYCQALNFILSVCAWSLSSSPHIQNNQRKGASSQLFQYWEIRGCHTSPVLLVTNCVALQKWLSVLAPRCYTSCSEIFSQGTKTEHCLFKWLSKFRSVSEHQTKEYSLRGYNFGDKHLGIWLFHESRQP